MMNTKLKNRVLLLAVAVAIVLCYNLAISKTLELHKEQKALEEQAVMFKNTPKQVSLLKQKQMYYDSILTKNQLIGSSLQNNLLKTINTYASKQDLKVLEFQEPHVATVNELLVKSYRFTVEGSFKGIMALLYTIEQKTRFGEIINVEFEKKKDYKTQKEHLQASVILKSFG